MRVHGVGSAGSLQFREREELSASRWWRVSGVSFDLPAVHACGLGV